MCICGRVYRYMSWKTGFSIRKQTNEAKLDTTRKRSLLPDGPTFSWIQEKNKNKKTNKIPFFIWLFPPTYRCNFAAVRRVRIDWQKAPKDFHMNHRHWSHHQFALPLLPDYLLISSLCFLPRLPIACRSLSFINWIKKEKKKNDERRSHYMVSS